jgi:rSAM/selenodomain-associated transferase 1
MYDSCLVIMAKQPLPGMAKTRIGATLGDDYAAALAEQLLHYTLAKAQKLSDKMDFRIQPILCVAPKINHYFESLATHFNTGLIAQTEGDLGGRMQAATRYALSEASHVIIIGTDCPALSARHIHQARKALDQVDVYLQPAQDGGYVLIALKENIPCVFKNKPWSTPELMVTTVTELSEAGISYAIGDYLNDIDEADDLVHLPLSFARPTEELQ